MAIATKPRPGPPNPISRLWTQVKQVGIQFAVALNWSDLPSAYAAFQSGRATALGMTNFNYAIQASTNLGTTNWVNLVTNLAPFNYTDASASNYPVRFYRALCVP